MLNESSARENEGKFLGGGEGRQMWPLSRELESRHGGNKKMYGAAVRQRVKNRGLLRIGSSDRPKISASEVCTIVFESWNKKLARLFFTAMWNNWGLAFFMFCCFRRYGSILRFFGIFRQLWPQLINEKKPSARRPVLTFFVLSWRTTMPNFGLSTLKNHDAKLISREGIFPEKYSEFAQLIALVLWQAFVISALRACKNKKVTQTSSSSRVDAIMSTRLVSNYSQYWPIYGVYIY